VATQSKVIYDPCGRSAVCRGVVSMTVITGCRLRAGTP
jgi:hypothetical protein